LLDFIDWFVAGFIVVDDGWGRVEEVELCEGGVTEVDGLQWAR
jgi:hypothetical protein